MSADARRFGWRWIVAAVSADDVVVLLDPSRPARGRTVVLNASAAIGNIVTWVDTAP